ncbi:EEF1A lysine methyltransferase 1 [Leptopilina boulardi]|uniref:EEF1A lysine methyltransferase 1 n=1 Tax=Leptopilina boulardi TaxID=63433 RepID=UPI0021F57BFE|nr:EEF1A lysine methyltransferase 1 [Leptopilina boulardi]
MNDLNVIDDDEEISLCPSTLAALQEFYSEREEREKLQKCSMSNEVLFDENWQLSQFWYDDETTDKLTKGAINCTQDNGKIALISCPTLYKSIKKVSGNREVTIFEFDERFSAFGSDFVNYDYNNPLNFPSELKENYDLVIADPPFLSDECLTKTASTIKSLAKEKIIICTGAIMKELVEKLLDVKKCEFLPRHKNNLANEFFCYSNFNFDNCL